ncbi:MAG TPA: MobF family relaxase [Verrucomicrobiae bacterium]|nr:MobF family relaxase [Verrucomicrobiae bacterium]
MLSPKTKYSLINAKEYFEEHLCAGDYYCESERIVGQWFGTGAELLELSGRVGQEEFLRLCDNLHPQTGERLTQRLKTTRTVVDETGRAYDVANRRIFFDFTFSPPKSVSIAALIGNDPRIVEAHHRAVIAALRELERFAGTRVHTGDSITDRTTGNIVCAIFRHDTSRALDPHLHSHCIVFNATRDSVEGRWKALQNFEMLRARKYVENVYYHELVRDLKRWGYQVDTRPRGDFEIKGVPQELCERFSKRHREIDDKTNELLAQNPELADGNVAQIRENVAQKNRAPKRKDIQSSELQTLWTGQISESERAAILALKHPPRPRPDESDPRNAETAVMWAEEHLFDRRSVVLEFDLWRHALEHVRGQNVTVEDVQEVTQTRDYIRDNGKPYQVTTKKVLEREWDIVCLAKNGIGHFGPLATGRFVSNSSLDQDQRQAVEQILSSRDFVTLFRGGAGTGKSYVLRDVRNGLINAGHTIQVVAPQRQQVIDLERDGMTGTRTVSELLMRQIMPRGAVVIVDEAGQIGAKQMQQLLRYVKDSDGRIILSGDTRQHGAVEASDALRAIEKYSGLRAAELHVIRRQDPARAKTEAERARIAQYRQAVKEASEGRIADSFHRLDSQGAIVECSHGDQQELLVREYLELAERNHSIVVVSQTWSEIHKVNEHVRSVLKSRRLIGSEETAVAALEPVDLTSAQKRDRRFYDENSVVVLNRNAGGFKKGERTRLVTITETGVVLESADRIRTVPFRFLDRLTICRPKDLGLARGDRLQLKANGRTRHGQRLANGELVTVDKVLTGGRVKLHDDRILEKDYRQFVRGFAITSYASQGKTVDYVLFSDSAIKPATNRQQWYVTISRGRRGIKIFTSDKEQLLENIVRSGDRALAMDLANNHTVETIGTTGESRYYSGIPASQAMPDFIASRMGRGNRQSQSH